MNDDPKWDELEEYILSTVRVCGCGKKWVNHCMYCGACAGGSGECEESHLRSPKFGFYNDRVEELILHLGPQVEADEWPSIVGDTE